MSNQDLQSLPFDLYSRNAITGRVVQALAKKHGRLKILEAGGRGGLMYKFMPDQDMLVLDIREPETIFDKALFKNKKYIVGSVLDMPVDDHAVDLTVSMEMLEHLAPMERPKAIQEMLRVSKLGVIVGFPQDSPENDQAERQLNQYFQALTGEEHPWLLEHIANRPLPQPREIENVFHEAGLKFVSLSSNNTLLWTFMQYLIFTTHRFETDIRPAFKFYNQHLAELGDNAEPAYRKVYIALRPQYAEILKAFQEPKAHVKAFPLRLELFNIVFDIISSQLVKKDEHIVNIEQLVEAKDVHIRNLDSLIQKKEQALVAGQELIDSFKDLVEAKDAHIQEFESSKLGVDSDIKKLQSKFEDIAMVMVEKAKMTIQLEAKLGKLGTLLGERSEALTQLREKYDLQKNHILNLEISSTAKDGRIAVQDQLIASLEQTSQAKTHQITSLEQKTQEIYEHVAQQDSQLLIHEEKATQTQQLVQTLDQMIKDKDRHIQNIEPAYIELQGFKKLFFMRSLFSVVHAGGRFLLLCRKRAQHAGVAVHILRTQGLHEFTKSLRRYVHGSSIVQNPLHTNALAMDDQYKLLREKQLLSKTALRTQRSQSRAWKVRPLVSVVCAAYYVEPVWLENCIQSILHQTYDRWELVIPIHPELGGGSLEVLKKLAKKDQRIRLIMPVQINGVVSLWNEGFKKAKGEFVLPVHGHDELAVQALFAYVSSIQGKEADVIYADEDVVQADETLIRPQFKSGWNPDLLLSMNYWNHGVMFRSQLGKDLGWFRLQSEGAHEYDLWLRLTEKTHKITSVAQVLYHTRENTNTLVDNFEKTAALTQMSLKVLAEYAHRKNIAAKVSSGLVPNTFRFQRKIAKHELVSIIIPFKDKVELLKMCVPGVLNKTDYPEFEILLVSNNSVKKETSQYVQELVSLDSRIRALEYNVPFNYSKINNWAVQQAKGKYILLMNNDIEVISTDWLSAMVEHIQRSEVGAVGAQLLYSNNTIQHAGVVLGIGGAAGHAHKFFPAEKSGYFGRLNAIQNFSAVTAACLLTKKELYQKLGGLNEQDLAISFNDIDLCLKIRQAGYLITYTPYAKLYHHESISRGLEDNPAKQERFSKEVAYFLKAWGSLLRHDPYYNTNLTLKAENFSLDVF